MVSGKNMPQTLYWDFVPGQNIFRRIIDLMMEKGGYCWIMHNETVQQQGMKEEDKHVKL